jgi:hypothetical protein
MSVSILIPEELAKYPDLQKRLVDANRHFYPYVPAFLNDEKLPLRGTLNRRLHNGDRLTFMVIASGG